MIPQIIAEYRHFNGVKYEHRGTYQTEQEARSAADLIQKNGTDVVAVPDPDGTSLWLVYSRWSMPSKSEYIQHSK